MNVLKKNKRFLSLFLSIKKKIRFLPILSRFRILVNYNYNKDKSFIKPWNKNSYVKGHLILWMSKNNFFSTILDNKGNVLVTRSGGNTLRKGTRQRATIFSSDSATYECCFIGKKWGLNAVDVHILSSLRIPQIKSSLEGLSSSNLKVLSIFYRPIKPFGGCWLKKPRWV